VAETLAGRAASDFVLAENLSDDINSALRSSTRAPKDAGGEVLTTAMDGSGGTVAKFGGDGTTLINSAIVDVSGNVGIGTTTPGSRLTVGDGTPE
jgi:hypothetical protein